MTSITLTAPAKVNLYLKVLGRRKDGYHDIITVFERIDLADRITISRIPKGIALSSDKTITKKPQDNLMHKAAKLILRETGQKNGVRIHIKKNIPIAAGLGGGSSDAASVLLGINRLFGLKLTSSRLISMGKRLGADVPFFLLDAPLAIGRGKGADLQILQQKIKPWHLVVYPGFGVSTKGIYDYFDTYRPLTKPHHDVKIMPSLAKLRTIGDLEHMLYNDLEDVSLSRNAGIRAVLERLAVSLGKKAIVSGSGPSVFCLYGTKKEALKAGKKLFDVLPGFIRDKWKIFVAGPLMKVPRVHS